MGGYIMGLEPRDMAPAIKYKVLATACCIGAASVSTATNCLAFLFVGGSLTVMAARKVFEFPHLPTSINSENKHCYTTAGKLMIWGWFAYPLVQLVGLDESVTVTVHNQLHMFALLDMYCKLGAGYIMMRDPSILQAAYD